MSKNLGLICCLEQLRNYKRRFSFSPLKHDNKIAFIENIDHFAPNLAKTKRALLTLSPASWLTALRQYPNIKLFNVDGLTFIMVKVLNEQGYLVDILSYRESDYQLTRCYDLFIGHGGNCASLIDALEKNQTVILQYVSQAYWKEFLKQSNERYERVCRRKNIPLIASHIRSHSEQERRGEERLAEHAKYFFTGNCPRMIRGYGQYATKIHPVGWAAYVEKDLIVTDRDFDAGRKGFLYVAGTGGNIQKGLDLLLETFARTPDLFLYIYCDVEKEVRALYRKELSLPNIQYVYHLRFGPLRRKLRALLRRVNFTITAPIDTGIGTAFLGSLGIGLIPIGYADMPCTPDNSHLTDSWDVDSLVRNVREASRMPVEWCQKASALSMQNFRENWSPMAFEARFSQFIKQC
jgi:hypothetical protein